MSELRDKHLRNDRTNPVFKDAGSVNELDSQLMSAVSLGDQKAFEHLYERYAPVLFAICIRVLRQEFEAREVLSEVFVEVWKKASNYSEDRGTVKAYLVTLTRCRSIDYLRSRTSKNVNQEKLEKVWNATPENKKTSVDPPQSVLQHEQDRILRDAVNGLSEVQRTVLNLAYFEGLTQVEISSRLDIPLGTVKTAIRRGIACLRETLEDTEFGKSRS